MSLKNNKILVKFIYNNQVLSISSEPYKSINELKLKILKQIYKPESNLHVFYNNSDLTKQENEQIGNLFPLREMVTFKLMLPLKETGDIYDYYINNSNNYTDNIFNTDTDEYSEKKIISNKKIYNLNDSLNSYTLTKNNLKKKKDLLSEQFSDSTINSLINKKNKKTKYFLKNDKLNLKYKSNSNIISNNIITEKDKSVQTINKKKNKIKFPLISSPNTSKFMNNIDLDNDEFTTSICSCEKNQITYYCRNCREFVCDNCKKEKHKGHLKIKLQLNNLVESINLYAMILQTDIEEKIRNNINFTQRLREGKNILDIENFQENLIKKLSVLANVYINLITLLQQNLLNNSIEENEIILNEFNLNSKILSGELNNIIYDMKNNFSIKKMNFEQFKKYIDLINKEEIKWEDLNETIVKYKLSNEINEKILRMYDKMNENIDELINLKTPFNLDNKSLEYLNKLGQNNNLNDSFSSSENNNNINMSKGLKEMFKLKEKEVEINNNNNNNNNKENEKKKDDDSSNLSDNTKRNIKNKL